MRLGPTLTFLSILVNLSRCETCVTTGKSNPKKSTPNTPCVFPFVFKNERFTGCTTDDRGRLWCSTKVHPGTNEHVKGNWGLCPSTCIRSCSQDQICKEKDQCPHINSEFKRYKSMKKSNPNKDPLRAKLKSLVCQTKPNKFCCPSSTKATTTPEIQTGPKKSSDSSTEASTTPEIHTQPKKSSFPPSCQTAPTSNFLGNILPSPGQCGISCNTEARVIKGQDTKLGEFPWAALLGYRFVKKTFDFAKNKVVVKERYIRYQCGGTLINTWYVLTAAHCHQEASKDQIKEVVLGEWEVTDSELTNKDPDCPSNGDSCMPKVQKIGVDWVVGHKDYSKSSIAITNDIALVRLKTEAVLNAGVQLACLPLIPHSMATVLQVKDLGDGLEGYSGTVIGWGHAYNFDEGDFETAHVAKAILQKAILPILSVQECQKGHLGIFLSEDHMCAGGRDDGADFCQGDSGGGIFIRKNTSDILDQQLSGYVQVGIVSFGSLVCGSSPGVYTRITQFIQWITNNLQP